MRLTIATLTLLAATGLALAQNNNNNNTNGDQCDDANIPIEQLSEKCRAERAQSGVGTTSDGMATGSTTTPDSSGIIPEESNQQNDVPEKAKEN